MCAGPGGEGVGLAPGCRLSAFVRCARKTASARAASAGVRSPSQRTATQPPPLGAVTTPSRSSPGATTRSPTHSTGSAGNGRLLAASASALSDAKVGSWPRERRADAGGKDCSASRLSSSRRAKQTLQSPSFSSDPKKPQPARHKAGSTIRDGDESWRFRLARMRNKTKPQQKLFLFFFAKQKKNKKKKKQKEKQKQKKGRHGGCANPCRRRAPPRTRRAVDLRVLPLSVLSLFYFWSDAAEPRAASRRFNVAAKSCAGACR